MTTPSSHPSDNDLTENAGSETDQHVTGSGEEGDFVTDETPTGGTPSHGSSNEGINAAGGNRHTPESERA